MEEAVARNIPWIRLGKNSLVQLGYGVNQQRFQATITGKTSSIAVDIACNKELTKKLLDDAAIPVPTGDLAVSYTHLDVYKRQSEIRTTISKPFPPVDVAAANFPLKSSATQPTVPFPPFFSFSSNSFLRCGISVE